MKQAWNKLAGRIDNLTVRERVIIFLTATLVLITLLNMFVLDPFDAEQKQINRRLQDEQSQIVRMQAEIHQQLNAGNIDPDASVRSRLETLQQQKAELQQAVTGIQKGLVSPDKMPALLEEILASNTRLRLVELKKLPVTNLAESSAQDASADAATPGLYRHGVQLTVRGGYLDMLNYLAQLEGLSSQLLWGDVVFSVDKYPNASMTLIVYTLSLDKQWLHI